MSILGDVLFETDQIAVYVRMLRPDLEIYRYRLLAGGMDTFGVGYTKEEAKQSAAQRMLNLFVQTGYPVPPPHGFDDEPDPIPNAYTNARLVREFCFQYSLDLYFSLVDESNVVPRPSHYTIRLVVENHGERRASANTMKRAKEQVARAMLDHLETIYGDISPLSVRSPRVNINH